MKKKTFGNIIHEPILTEDNNQNDNRFRKNGMEFLTPDDRQAARDINRPIIQLYEDVEKNYDILQTISKMVLMDKTTGIIPGILEEFNVDNLIVSSFYNSNDYYLRIPTGAFIINRRRNPDLVTPTTAFDIYDTSIANNSANKALRNATKLTVLWPSREETLDFDATNYVSRDNNSAFVINKPKVELFERELADHYCIDLAEQDNDISIDYSVSSKKINYTCSVVRNVVNDDSLTTKKYTLDTNSNVFDITNNFYKTIGNNYMSKDGYYSLEELIPIKNLTNGNYTIFFRAGDYSTTAKAVYSISGDYGICETTNFSKLNAYTNVELFKITLKNNAITKKTLCLSNIDRSKLELKNLDIRNNYITVGGKAWHLCSDNQIKDLI